MSMILRINGVDIKNPSDLSYSRYNITKAGRVASGDMKLDLVAKKRKLFFTYEVIKGKDMEHILSLIDTDELFFTVTYEENNVIKQAVMYVGEISQDRFRTRDSTTKQWYWKNFTFNLIEQ